MEASKTNLLEQALAKQTQLKEALNLLDRVGGDIDWALDFCEYDSIKEHLSPLSYAISDAADELEGELDKLEECMESYETEQVLALKDVDMSTDLKYCIS